MTDILESAPGAAPDIDPDTLHGWDLLTAYSDRFGVWPTMPAWGVTGAQHDETIREALRTGIPNAEFAFRERARAQGWRSD